MSRPAWIAWKRKAECIASRTWSFPRKEKERFEIPPLVREPGQRSLISGSASMNAFAYSSCSSIPVATASTFGSKMMSSAAKPMRRAGRTRDRRSPPCVRPSPPVPPRRTPSRRRLPRVGEPFRACVRNASSPSFRQIELTIALALEEASRPASSTDQRELSTMIGSRATSGSVATHVEEGPSSPVRCRGGRRPCSRRGGWRRHAPAPARRRPLRCNRPPRQAGGSAPSR